MTGSPCPYLKRERTAWRENLDLSRPAPMTAVITWYCEHPFHGIRVDLGDSRTEAERRCGLCSLPRPDEGTAED